MSSETLSPGGQLDRRTFLKGAAGASALAATPVAASAPAAAQDSAFGGWFDDVSNYDGVVDRTGSSEVTVEVGASGNDGDFAFGPAAVRVDPGTTVVWEWTGKGGSHDVAAEDGSFESEMVGEAGHTFEHTFEEKGVVKYACTPHKPMGMKGAIVVGKDAASSASSASDSSGSSGSDSSGSSDSEGSGTASGFGDWFGDVSNYDGVVDATGNSEVEVTVGAAGNDGNFAFGPAAVRVDPGTTVVWTWNGKGGGHNVVADDGSFESEMVSEAGHTFEQTFDEEGISKYYCSPHRPMGMKGAVVVGDEAASSEPESAASAASGSSGSNAGELLTIGFGGALVAVLLGLPIADARSREKRS